MRPRLLIVDDDASFRRIAVDLLQLRGFEVVGDARTASEAVVRVRALQPDAVLLDVHLPDGDGFTVVPALRLARPGLRVLLTSSDAGAASERLAEQCGATGFIPKTELVTTHLTSYLGPPREN
jgi:two-component system, NarL family, response regulator DevR